MSNNVEDLKTYTARKEGKVLLEDVVENLYEAVKRGMVKDLVFVAVQADGQIVHGLNTMDILRAIGLLDVGKEQLVTEMYEDDY